MTSYKTGIKVSFITYRFCKSKSIKIKLAATRICFFNRLEDIRFLLNPITEKEEEETKIASTGMFIACTRSFSPDHVNSSIIRHRLSVIFNAFLKQTRNLSFVLLLHCPRDHCAMRLQSLCQMAGQLQPPVTRFPLYRFHYSLPSFIYIDIDDIITAPLLRLATFHVLSLLLSIKTGYLEKKYRDAAAFELSCKMYFIFLLHA